MPAKVKAAQNSRNSVLFRFGFCSMPSRFSVCPKGMTQAPFRHRPRIALTHPHALKHQVLEIHHIPNFMIPGGLGFTYLEFIAILSPLLTVTSATALSPLSVRTIRPSVKCIMCRTTLPIMGIIHVWKISVFGSKRITVFGFTADSLYQTMHFASVIQ